MLATTALVVVVAASVTMERAAISLGGRYGVPQIVTGGLVLAAVISLPNAVAAVYLPGRGRGPATLSTALNSNTLNVVAGLLLPGALLGLGRPSGQAGLVTVWYVGLTVAVLAVAWRHRGLGRRAGAAVIFAYAAFAASSSSADTWRRRERAHRGAGRAVRGVPGGCAGAARPRARARGRGRRPDPGSGSRRGCSPPRHRPFAGCVSQRAPGSPALAAGPSGRANGGSLPPGLPARRVWALSFALRRCRVHRCCVSSAPTVRPRRAGEPGRELVPAFAAG